MLLLTLLAACGGADKPADTADTSGSDPWADVPRGDCNPVEEGACLFPFPSSFYLAEDAATGTGLRVAFGPASLPADKFGTQIDPTHWNVPDGFPILGNLYTLLPGASLEGTMSFADLGAYTDADVKTVLLNAETGERVPHYVEREAFDQDGDRAAMVIHPAVPMAYGTRYVVGVRGLVDDAGGTAPTPAGFAALRDATETEDADLERQRAHYDEVVFPALDAAGFSRDELQMAWDFVTVSEESSLAGMRKMRDEGVALWEKAGKPYTITRTRDYECGGGATIGRIVKGTFTAPSYLDGEGIGAALVTGDDGLPAAVGTFEASFTAVIPCSVLAEPGPALLVQHGHGLFGSEDDVTSGFITEMADQGRWIAFATTYIGLSGDDASEIAAMMATDPSEFHTIPALLSQAHLDAVISAKLFRGPLVDDPAFMVEDTHLIDPSRLVYYGVSMGSVLGGAQVAMSPEIDDAVMQIAGMPFSALLTRSNAFTSFLLLLGAKYEDPADVSVIVPLAQMLWDPVEAGGWAPHIVDGAAVGGKDDRRVLVQVGIGDDTVTSIGGEIYARVVGAGQTQPEARPVFGVPTLGGPDDGAALTEWDYGVAENDIAAPSGVDPNPHYLVPSERSAKQEIVEFFASGAFVHPCDGVCDPD